MKKNNPNIALRLILNPGVSILISPLLLVCYRVMIVGSLTKHKKRYLVTGNWKEYISNIFSDSSFFLLSLFALLFFCISCVITIREIKHKKQYAWLVLAIILAIFTTFMVLLYQILFVH